MIRHDEQATTLYLLPVPTSGLYTESYTVDIRMYEMLDRSSSVHIDDAYPTNLDSV